MALLVENNVNEFVNQVASDAPAPGGGSAAALSAALGAGLLEMAIRISVKKKPDAALEALLPALEKDRKRLTELVDEDTAAFNDVLAAFGFPKATDAQKAERSEKIQGAFERAAAVPAQTMACALRVLETGRIVAEKCGANVASDAGTGVQMAFAGVQGAAYNVRINLSSIKNESLKAKLAKGALDASTQAEEEKSYAVAAVLSKV